MVSHQVVYQLGLFALIGFFIMLPLTWSRPGVSVPVPPADPFFVLDGKMTQYGLYVRTRRHC